MRGFRGWRRCSLHLGRNAGRFFFTHGHLSPKGRGKNKFPILSLDASLLMRQKSELISQVKLYYLLVTVYCLLVTVYCLLITDYWSLITACLVKSGTYFSLIPKGRRSALPVWVLSAYHSVLESLGFIRLVCTCLPFLDFAPRATRLLPWPALLFISNASRR